MKSRGWEESYGLGKSLDDSRVSRFFGKLGGIIVVLERL